MQRISVNGVELCVETFGDPADPPVLLVGLTMLSWPDELCAALARGHVVRYDLRDAGRSTFVDPDAPSYDLRDLVTDASELLVALDLGRTHVVGVGVGGFIAQLLALDHHDQVASLTLVSTRPVVPGPVDPDLPDHAAEMTELFGRPAPDWTDRGSVVDYMTGSARAMSGSRGFDEQDVRAAAGSVFDRARRTAKAQRASHLGSMVAAIDCQPRWRERLGEITVPTLVVHGDEDPFFPHGNGPALAAEITRRHFAHAARHRPGPAARDVAGRRGRTVAPHLLIAILAQEWRLRHTAVLARAVCPTLGLDPAINQGPATAAAGHAVPDGPDAGAVGAGTGRVRWPTAPSRRPAHIRCRLGHQSGQAPRHAPPRGARPAALGASRSRRRWPPPRPLPRTRWLAGKGRIAIGRDADLLIISGDLADDPEALLHPEAAFRGGHRLGDTLR